MKILRAILVLLVLSWPTHGVAATINAASCSVSDIDVAIDAAADGDTVSVPSGTCDYPSLMTAGIVNNGSGLCRVTTTAAHGLDTGAYVLLSANTGASGCGAYPPTYKKITKISDTVFDMQSTSFSGTYTTSKTVQQTVWFAGNKSVSVIGGSGGTTALTGRPKIRIESSSGSRALRFSGFTITYTDTTNETAPFTVSTDNTSTARIDNCSINTGAVSNAINTFGSYGSIDNNYFIGDKTKIIVYGKNGAAASVPEWSAVADFGTNKFMFIENNTFISEYSPKSWAAVKTNYGGRAVVRYNNTTNQTFVQHGAIGISASYEGRSGRAAEVYNNTFTCPYPTVTGNMCYAWMEIFGGSALLYGNTIFGDWANGFSFMVQRVSDSNAGGSPWGFCDGGTSHTWDGNTSPAGYVCHDQTGAGPDVGGSSTVPQTISEPLHWWGNTGSRVNLVVQSAHLQEDREYCTHDTSTACGGITTIYTAYTCPHPLAGLGGTCDSTTAGIAGYNVITSAPPSIRLHIFRQ